MLGVRPAWSGDLGQDVWDDDEVSGGETPRMLAVVRLGSAHDLLTLERARAISSEHEARLVIIATWEPPWWLCMSMAPGSQAPSILVLLQQTTERLLCDFADRTGAEIRMLVSRAEVRRAVDAELTREAYRYVVGRETDLPRRLARRWRHHDLDLAVIRF